MSIFGKRPHLWAPWIILRPMVYFIFHFDPAKKSRKKTSGKFEFFPMGKKNQTFPSNFDVDAYFSKKTPEMDAS